MSTSPTRAGCSRPLSRKRHSNRGKLAFNFDPGRDVPTTLREFGKAYIELLCRPGGGSAIRTVMAIAERMPDVGRRYYANVLEKNIDRFAAYLETRVKIKELAIDDFQLAASQFMLMCQASLFLPFIFQAAPPPSAERMTEVVESATMMFLPRIGPKVNRPANSPYSRALLFFRPTRLHRPRRRAIFAGVRRACCRAPP